MPRTAFLLPLLLLVSCDEPHPAEPLPAEQATCYFTGGGIDWQPAASCEAFRWHAGMVDTLATLSFSVPRLAYARPRAGLRGSAGFSIGTTPVALTRGEVCRIDVDTLVRIAQAKSTEPPRYYAQGKGGCESPLYQWDAGTQMAGAGATPMDLRAFSFGTVLTID
jgi:hypothetical protein